ncbi:acetyltransferase [Paucihalobacter ruber]|uniref:Acetyltransferase n=1 Tax=Paucihalobacter ruber TaxID=2567861 RepID=A0A506PKM2_9FLAO|nr:acetyltransferase [Paucihalobacter ruber]TPV34058.1 acetyltransferase [Paucihalobacter ruber]
MLKNNSNIVLIGASGHAKVVIDIIEKLNRFTIVGLIDSFKPIGTQIFEYKVIGTEDDLPELTKKYHFNAGIITIGDNWIRKVIHQKIENLVPEFELITAIHPSAVIGKQVKIGNGTVVMPGAIINSAAKVGKCCIINTKVSLGHDSEMKDYSSLAPNVTVGGNVSIGSYTAICMGANIIQDISIGKHSIVGAGALVNKNIEDYNLVYGVPAKFIRKISKGEKYLYPASDYVKR